MSGMKEFQDKNGMWNISEESRMITNITRHGWFKPRGLNHDLQDAFFKPDREGWALISRIDGGKAFRSKPPTCKGRWKMVLRGGEEQQQASLRGPREIAWYL